MKKVLFFLAAITILVLFPSECAFAKRIALTFDDGPHPRFTPEILKILARYKVRATFFVLGKKVYEYPCILKAEYDAGHQIGNHSFNHPRFTKIGKQTIRQQVESTQEAVFEVLGIWPAYFRPPYSAKNSIVEAIIKSYALKMAHWEASPEDYKCEPAWTIAQKVLSAIKASGKQSIAVVMHDNCPNTPKAVEIIIQELEKMDVQFVTMSELDDQS